MNKPKSADEAFAILRAAAVKDATAAYNRGLQAGQQVREEAARGPSRDQLQAEYKERVAALRLSGRQSPAKGRLLEEEFIELGLSAEDVDLNPSQPNWQGHRMGDGPPPSR